ncbi:hypothetical protein [Arthrobacter sp. L77]|uniref:hypothetical protein n=1 Tax=Arthrobacter sp. L77 TaxID=1496689 RepID=UPI0012E02744|nr:hypothetical protein [Arthrobacter sp. L77]
MRAIEVDERDSTWERDDARYRVYVFEGAGNAVTTVDLLDATVEQALETATEMSNEDALLWALALVEHDSRGMRGLIWLSGMDYNDTPSSPREWMRRGQMQDRYLRARHNRGLQALLPTGLRVVRVFPEWVSGWPLWEDFSDEYRLTGSDLGLSSALSRGLYEWNQTWRDRGVDDPVPTGWRAAGEILTRQLQVELSGVAEVRPEFLTQ